MRISTVVFAALAAVASARVGSGCSGDLAHPCICLDKDICKNTVHGTPVERDRKGNYPCPSDPGNVWGCYIWCD